MKASIQLQSLKQNCKEKILKSLSEIEGLSGIATNENVTRLSFNYENEEAALAAVSSLRTLGYPYTS